MINAWNATSGRTGRARTDGRPSRRGRVGRAAGTALLLLALAGCGASVLQTGAQQSSALPDGSWQRIEPPERQSYERFGHSVALHGDTVAVGALGSAAAGEGGALYLFSSAGQDVVLEARLQSEAGGDDGFGYSTTLGDGIALSGAIYAVDADGSRTGAAYLFSRRSGEWLGEGRLETADAADGAVFGAASDISGDVLAIAATGATANAVHVFEAGEGGWQEAQKLTPEGDAGGRRFGQTLDLEGRLLAIGAPEAIPGQVGAVYLYASGDQDWESRAVLGAPAGAESFGRAIALAGDTVAVSAIIGDRGVVFLYRLEAGEWQPSGTLEPSAGGGRHFGASLAATSNVLAVGEPDQGDESGSVHLFSDDGSGRWEVLGIVSPPDQGEPSFGVAVALTEQLLLVGASAAQDDTGVAYLFEIQGVAAGNRP